MEREILQSIFKVSSDGIIVTDNKLQIIDYNEMALKVFGLTPNQMSNKKLYSIFKDTKLLDKCLEEGQNFKDEICIFSIGEDRVRCIVNIFPIEKDGKAIGIVMAFKDAKQIHSIVNSVMGHSATYTFEDIITKNQSMKKIIQYSKKAANADCNILLEGNKGTGKEIFAQAMHNFSKRAKGPFIAVNCAAIPRELIENELFGYEKNAFTGGNKESYPGKFELAEGGTIFLNEIEELPLEIQAKLLKMLDNHKIVRVGSTYEKSINVRVISATNKKLMDEVEKKNFRHDLYYKLNVIDINLLDLKDRKEDIELLIAHFLNKLNSKNPNKIKEIEVGALDKLKAYGWDGNIRELKNVLGRAYYLSEGSKITTKSVANLLGDKSKVSNSSDTQKDCLHSKEADIIPLRHVEEESIKKALKYCNGKVECAAKLLDISKATIYRKIIKYGIKIN